MGANCLGWSTVGALLRRAFAAALLSLLVIFSAQVSHAARVYAPLGSPADPGEGTWPTEIAVNPTHLNWGVYDGTVSPPQNLWVTNPGGGDLHWNAVPSADWIQVAPPSGVAGAQLSIAVDPTSLAPGKHHATVAVRDKANPEIQSFFDVFVDVQLGNAPPMGDFMTPAGPVAGVVPITGWVLDDIGVNKVVLTREQGPDQVYVGDALFIEGARPDLAQAYPGYPNHYKAGWGYMLLTNFLPNGGNGAFTICATATDLLGMQNSLGCKPLIVDNANAVKPFGVIDTPAQGGAATGNHYTIAGWALTPPPAAIPTDGSTLHVVVDGVTIGQPTYNILRQDIAAQFRGYANSGGAGWEYSFDTTPYANGVHTVGLMVNDSAGNANMLGNRQFIVKNQAPQRPTSPRIVANPPALNFTTATSGSVTAPQSFLVLNGGGGNLQWYATATQPWIGVSPTAGAIGTQATVAVEPGGLPPGSYHGAIVVSDPDAGAAGNIQVNLTIQNGELAPIGGISTPICGSTAAGSVPVTGWALDDVGVTDVKIYRQSGGNLVYIGDAAFVEGARPDVTLNYWDYPNHQRAGWSYSLLSRLYPDGPLQLFAIATDGDGQATTLGSRTIVIDNAHAVKPFGAIDAPATGAVASGSAYVNTGWALTPLPNAIPSDGSTIAVWVDGVNRGHPSYNIYRSDIATLFPGYANSAGAGGYFYLDTTQFTNGVHTIYWMLADDAGNSDGIGSRYFNTRNFAIVNVVSSRAGLASAVAPQFATIQEAIDAVAWLGTVHGAGGVYTDSVHLDKNIFLYLDGPTTLTGDLAITHGSFFAPTATLTVTGDFTHSAGAFVANGGAVVFAGAVTQTIRGATAFHNVVVQPGARVVTADNVGVHGTLTNGGVTQQTQMIDNPWAFKFDLTGVVVTATATSGPTVVQVERCEENHPDATGNVRTGRYWAISATGGGYTVALTLPHTGLADPFVCGYTGADWECARTTFDAAHVTLAGVTNFATFSAWAVGNAADAPKGSYLPTIMKSAD